MAVKKIDLKPLKEIMLDASQDTAETMMMDIVAQEYTPYFTGRTQESMKVKRLKRSVQISNSTPYVKHIFFGDKFQFSRRRNSQAQARWWEQYLEGGEREEMPFEAFAEAMRERLE